MVEAFWSVNCNRDCSEGALSHALHLCALAGGDWRLFNEACARYKLGTGMSALVAAVVRDGRPEICLETPVSRIEQDGDAVVVIAEPNVEFCASWVVVALPLNALTAIEFLPALSEGKAAAIREGAPAGGFKLWLTVQGSSESSLFMAPATEPLMFARYEGEVPSGSLFGCYGAERSVLGAEPLKVVRDAVGSWFGARIEECWMHDWAEDAFALETWRIPRPTQSTRYAEELERPEGRVFLAGADYARGWCGFVDGAVESGLRVARTLIDRSTGLTLA
jgi:monoamine oxidase